MNLRRRTLITLAISLLLLVVTLYITSQTLLMNSISEIQEDNTQKDLGTINDLLFRDLDDLNTINNHWATLGESSFFDERSHNIIPGTEKILNTTGVDFVIISSAQEGVIYYKMFNSQENNLSSYTNDLDKYLEKNNSLIYSDNSSKNRQGILLLSSGAFLISSNPILGSPDRILILGRHLKIPENGQLIKIPGLSLKVIPFLAGETIPVFHDVDRAFSYGSPLITKKAENNTIEGFSLLRDNQGRAVFQIKISENPYIENKGQQTLIYFIIFFLIIGLFLGFIILIYLDQIVLFRINNLNNRVQEITKSNDLSQRLSTNGADDEISRLSNAINSLFISLESSWDEIQQSRLKYRNIFYNTGTAMAIIEENGEIALINSEFENLSGFRKGEVEGKKGWEDFFPEDIKKMRKYRILRKNNPDQAPRNYESHLLDRKGNLKNVYLTVTTVPGTKQSLFSIIDITLLKKSLKEKEALLREVHHRVRNNMQIMISMFSMKASHTDDEKLKNILMESQDRIRSMAMVHDGLYRSPTMTQINMGEYIERLTTDLFMSYNLDNHLIKLEIKADPVPVGIDTAVPFGLLINELVSNAIKHAFKPGQSGEIKVFLFSSGEKITLIVEDNGVGLPKGFDIHHTQTMGMKMINALKRQLDAEIKLKTNGMTHFEIIFKELKYNKRF